MEILSIFYCHPIFYFFTLCVVGLTSRAGWLKSWTTSMAVREFLQNMIDHLSTQTSENIIFQKIDDFNFWSSSDVIKEIKSTLAIKEKDFPEKSEGLSFYAAEVSTGILAYIVHGRGKFILVQMESTLSRCHLFQFSTKPSDMSSAGCHGCGMKEAALFLLNEGCQVRMWMPAETLPSDYPGESWTFRLSPQGAMVVTASKRKTYTSRSLITIISDLRESWKFESSKYLAFHPPTTPDNRILIKTRNSGQYNQVLDYTLLLDDDRIFNYGIFVQESVRASSIKMGLDGRYKLKDRYRNMVHDVDSRLAIAVKVGVRLKPHLVIPRLLDCKESLQWIFSGNISRKEDPLSVHKFHDLQAMLVTGISLWKTLNTESIILVDSSWSQREINFTKEIGFFVFEVSDPIMTFRKNVLLPHIRKTAIPDIMDDLGLKKFMLEEWNVDYPVLTWGMPDEDWASWVPSTVIIEDIIYVARGIDSSSSLKFKVFKELALRGDENVLKKTFEKVKEDNGKPSGDGSSSKTTEESSKKTKRRSDESSTQLEKVARVQQYLNKANEILSDMI